MISLFIVIQSNCWTGSIILSLSHGQVSGLWPVNRRFITSSFTKKGGFQTGANRPACFWEDPRGYFEFRILPFVAPSGLPPPRGCPPARPLSCIVGPPLLVGC